MFNKAFTRAFLEVVILFAAILFTGTQLRLALKVPAEWFASLVCGLVLAGAILARYGINKD